MTGGRWRPFDVLADPAMAPPTGLAGARPTAVEGAGAEGPRPYILGELTWPAARERLAEVDLALLPVGSIEQHGPHLPLDTDAFDAEHLAHEVAAACSDPKPLVLPLVPYGVSYHHEDFDGTISVSPDTLSRMVYEVGMNLARQGIKKLVIVNGHGGNAPALKFAAQNINRDAHIFTTVETGESSDADIMAMVETQGDVHSGEIETSTALAVRPHLVRMRDARSFVPRFSSHYLDFTSKRSVEWYARTARISPSGVLGDPTKATAEKGRRMWTVMISNLVEFVEDLKGMTLEEIYQRRY
jgi:creatinine amidohydrolase/Fe(II)-dependent formamide hydrolase-like protein